MKKSRKLCSGSVYTPWSMRLLTYWCAFLFFSNIYVWFCSKSCLLTGCFIHLYDKIHSIRLQWKAAEHHSTSFTYITSCAASLLTLFVPVLHFPAQENITYCYRFHETDESLWHSSTRSIEPIVTPHGEYVIENRTECVHLKPLSEIRFRSNITYLFSNSAVIFLLQNAALLKYEGTILFSVISC